ncbi:hypothetical protein, partial [Mesorhizobium sp. M1C.F.Ca.ET.210.01.1.1]|uniref:phosphotransferase family protein n=1 Tax=Mesorhizobium sp. M1C.F.Ca.ET.210.01.1.1 TaxID=2563930 RepID=UPI001AEDAD7B
GNDGGLHLIDWDGLSLAPRERDLMFIGGAVGGRWGRENPLGFEEGYGSDRGDPRWIAWYRHWRILQDLIEFQQVLLGSDGEVEKLKAKGYKVERVCTACSAKR